MIMLIEYGVFYFAYSFKKLYTLFFIVLFLSSHQSIAFVDDTDDQEWEVTQETWQTKYPWHGLNTHLRKMAKC